MLQQLGDIVSSSPIFVGNPPFLLSRHAREPAYSAFVAATPTRPKMVYVGANDGMLHGFDADHRPEKLAFIPAAVFRNLHELTKPNYTHHKFFVDGTPTIGDVFYAGAWHTVLVGGLNKGGQSIYALDITDPGSFSEAQRRQHLPLGIHRCRSRLHYSRPAIVRMANGKWAAVFGNGYNNDPGHRRRYDHRACVSLHREYPDRRA